MKFGLPIKENSLRIGQLKHPGLPADRPADAHQHQRVVQVDLQLLGIEVPVALEPHWNIHFPRPRTQVDPHTDQALVVRGNGSWDMHDGPIVPAAARAVCSPAHIVPARIPVTSFRRVLSMHHSTVV